LGFENDEEYGSGEDASSDPREIGSCRLDPEEWWLTTDDDQVTLGFDTEVDCADTEEEVAFDDFASENRCENGSGLYLALFENALTYRESERNPSRKRARAQSVSEEFVGVKWGLGRCRLRIASELANSEHLGFFAQQLVIFWLRALFLRFLDSDATFFSFLGLLLSLLLVFALPPPPFSVASVFERLPDFSKTIYQWESPEFQGVGKSPVPRAFHGLE
jgi:hypothetical protein